MEPTKLQKNAGKIASLKAVRKSITELAESLAANHNSDATNRAISQLRYANAELLDRMIELGVTLKIEDGTPNA